MGIGVDVHDGVVAELFQIPAVKIHGVQAVLVIRIGKKHSSAVFTEETGIVKVSCGITVHEAVIVFDPCLEVVKNTAADDRNQQEDCQCDVFFLHMVLSPCDFCQ